MGYPPPDGAGESDPGLTLRDVVIPATPTSLIADGIALDRSSPVPLYHQIATSLARLILGGALAAGDQLPAERELAELAGVSRMTARQALSELERDGLVTVRHGAGTFVAAPKLLYDTIHLQGFTEMAEASGRSASSRVLDREIGPATPAEQRALGLAPGVGVYRLTRLRSLGGVPVVVETSALPEARFGSLLDHDPNQSLYGVLADTFGVRLTHADETVEARIAAPAEAELLGVPHGAPALVVEGVAWQGDTPVEWFRSVYPAERVRLSIQSQRAAPATEPASRTVSVILA